MPVLLLFVSFLMPYWPAQPQVADWTEFPLVAHALGGIGGQTATNSYEAFVENYNQGFRVFEVDLQLTSDEYLVARHDWYPYLYAHLGQKRPDVEGNEPISLDEFKSLLIDERYHPLVFGEIIGLLSKHPDAYIVTDTKSINRKEIKKQFSIIVEEAEKAGPRMADRIVPQIYNQQMYKQVEEIYPFRSYIYTLYESDDTNAEVLEFLKEHPKIKGVAMPENRFSQPFADAVKKLGVRVYLHTINQYLVYRTYRDAGVDGIYTDFLDRRELEAETRRHESTVVVQVNAKASLKGTAY
jgi:glycerophosphoryl diester phosphodiesterase